MLIPSTGYVDRKGKPSLSRRVNANSQLAPSSHWPVCKLIKKGEC